MIFLKPLTAVTMLTGALFSCCIVAANTHFSDVCQTTVTYHAAPDDRTPDTFSDPFGSGIGPHDKNNKPRENAPNIIKQLHPFLFDKGSLLYARRTRPMMGFQWECSDYTDQGICLAVCRKPPDLKYPKLYKTIEKKGCNEDEIYKNLSPIEKLHQQMKQTCLTHQRADKKTLAKIKALRAAYQVNTQ